MNSVKAKKVVFICRYVKGCQGSNQEVLAPSFLKVMSFAMMVSIGMGYCFREKGFPSFGILDYKYRFQNE